jgi:hypothetical protein
MHENEKPAKTPLEIVSSLPEELKPVGGYLLGEFRSAESDIRSLRAELRQAVDNPKEVEREIEEEGEEMEFSPEDIRGQKEYALDKARIEDDLKATIGSRSKAISLVNELAQGSYSNVIAFLETRLENLEFIAQKVITGTGQDVSPTYIAKRDAERQTLASFIDILKKKSSH